MAGFLQKKKKQKHCNSEYWFFCFCFNLKKGILLAGKNTTDSF